MAKYMRIRNSVTGGVREILISREVDKCDTEPLEDAPVAATLPSADATKADLVDWLTAHGVDAPAKASKAVLWELVMGHADQG